MKVWTFLVKTVAFIYSAYCLIIGAVIAFTITPLIVGYRMAKDFAKNIFHD